MDRIFAKYVKQWGFDAAVRAAKNVGIPFEECYFLCFGRLPV